MLPVLKEGSDDQGEPWEVDDGLDVIGGGATVSNGSDRSQGGDAASLWVFVDANTTALSSTTMASHG